MLLISGLSFILNPPAPIVMGLKKYIISIHGIENNVSRPSIERISEEIKSLKYHDNNLTENDIRNTDVTLYIIPGFLLYRFFNKYAKKKAINK